MNTSLPPQSATDQLLEDHEDHALAARAMERVRNSEERVFTLDDVERDLDLAD